MVCGTDLWDVERYASAGSIVICQPCVDLLKRAMDTAESDGETEVTLPPKVYGPVPDDDAAAAVAKAFVLTFRSGFDELDDYLEDARELAPLMAQGAARFGHGSQFTARIDAIRFPRPETAEVRYQILMNGNPVGMPFEGTAARRAGKWRVTRETIARALASTGVHLPPRLL